MYYDEERRSMRNDFLNTMAIYIHQQTYWSLLIKEIEVTSTDNN